ncbi:hypothetical protein ACGFWF_05985 [Streptomyces sp. NPDC048581]|uniref:hypothetical protein n=1 Tax=Streptomyces sp. NPDC048581 TaxID=3365572 RepID=UPI0037216C9C
MSAQDKGGGVAQWCTKTNMSRPILSAMAFDGSKPIVEARHAARNFMTEVQAVQGIPVSDRAMGMVELVVSELVTNGILSAGVAPPLAPTTPYARIIYDKRDNANAQEDWKAKTIYHVAGTPATMVPGIGDAAQRMLDAWTYDISNQEKGYNNDAAAAEGADRSLKSQLVMQFLVDEWANGRGKPGMDDPSVSDLQFDMRNDHTTGEKLAKDAIGR